MQPFSVLYFSISVLYFSQHDLDWERFHFSFKLCSHSQFILFLNMFLCPCSPPSFVYYTLSRALISPHPWLQAVCFARDPKFGGQFPRGLYTHCGSPASYGEMQNEPKSCQESHPDRAAVSGQMDVTLGGVHGVAPCPSGDPHLPCPLEEQGGIKP